MHLPVGMEPLLWQYQVKSEVVITIVKKNEKGKETISSDKWTCICIEQLLYMHI